MWPVARSIFAIFYVHELNNEAAHRARRQGDVRWSPGNATSLYVVCSIAGFAFDRLASNHIGPPWLALVGLAMLLPMAGALWRTQGVVNLACADPAGTANNRLTWANWIWLAIGALAWLFVAIGAAGIVLGLD
ncbi:hypothetical protein [Lysobacter claricitrinus]|uniref:hypothetical protein n=1 Tax=Lysobacter claricitrinus TaxID=3367728 RepID=UPI0037DA81F5